MEKVNVTRSERMAQVEKRKTFSMYLIIGLGLVVVPYVSALLFRYVDAMVKFDFTNLEFSYLKNYFSLIRFLTKTRMTPFDAEYGWGIATVSATLGFVTLYFAYRVKTHNTSIKRFSRHETEVGTPQSAGSGEHGTSRWQTEEEKNKSTYVWDTSQKLHKAGVVLGSKVVGGKEIFNLAVGDEHTIMFATTRLGKSRKEVMPLIWTCSKAGESMIINDPKGELFSAVSDYLKKEGYNVVCVNFREPLKGNKWNPMWLINRYVDQANACQKQYDEYCENHPGVDAFALPHEIRELLSDKEHYMSKATEVAGDLAYSITYQTGRKSSEPIWENGEMAVISALVLLVAIESKDNEARNLTSVYNLLAEYGHHDKDGNIPLNDYIDKLSATHPAKSAYAVARLAPSKTRGSFFTQTLTDLRLFADPEISDMTNDIDHDFHKFGVEKTAVFMIVPDDKKNRNVLASIYADQAYVASVEVANKYGGRLPIRIRNIFDEFGNMPPIVDFQSKITVGGGRGILFVLILQNYTQLEELYDKNASTITGNCHTWLYLGSHEPSVAKMFSEMTGVYTIEADGFNNSYQQNQTASTGSSISIMQRPLLTQDEVIKWDKKRSLVLRLGHYPSYYDLGDISQFKANLDFGFLSLRDSKAMVEKVVSNVETIYNYFPKLSKKTFGLVSDLTMVIKRDMSTGIPFDDLDYAQKASQVISLAKWDSIPLRLLKPTKLLILNFQEEEEADVEHIVGTIKKGKNLFGEPIVESPLPDTNKNVLPYQMVDTQQPGIEQIDGRNVDMTTGEFVDDDPDSDQVDFDDLDNLDNFLNN